MGSESRLWQRLGWSLRRIQEAVWSPPKTAGQRPRTPTLYGRFWVSNEAISALVWPKTAASKPSLNAISLTA